MILSLCMTYNPARMRPGFTEPPDDQGAFPVYQHNVTYPSAKGLMVQLFRDGGAFCCAGPAVVVPIAMADDSCLVASRFMFTQGEPIFWNNDQIGMPVWSTWGGCMARDK